MKSRVVPPLSARLIGGTLLALLFVAVQTTAAATLVVDRDGLAEVGNCAALTPADSPTISGAVAIAPAGSTIVVCPGPYLEPALVIPRTLTLRGAQAGNGFTGRVSPFPQESLVLGSITIEAPNVTIDGFWLSTLPSRSIMILVKTAGDGALVINNVLDSIGMDAINLSSANSVAVYLEHGPDGVTVVGNRISNVGSQITAQGILIGDSTAANPSLNILLSGNLIEDVKSTSQGAYGIQVNNGASTGPAASGFTTVAIRDNTIDDLTGGGWAHAIGLEGPTPNVEVVRNSISDVVDLTPALDGPDAAAVFFEANPFFPTAHVHRNNFDVTMAAYGIALHPALIASDGYRGKVDGTCNWWGAASGPGPVGPGSGARVTPKVRFDPWLDAPAPGGTCRDQCHPGDDYADHHYGDSHGEYHDKFTRLLEHLDFGTLHGGKHHEFMLGSDGGGLPLIARVDSPNAQFLVVEIYDAKGRLVATSLPSAGTAVATAPALLPGIYPVRVRNIGVLPIDYAITLITTVPSF